MIARDAADHVGITYVGETAGASRHAQILETVLGEHTDKRRLARWKSAFERHDAALEEQVFVELDGEGFSEIEQRCGRNRGTPHGCRRPS